MEYIPSSPRLFPVGRLDYETSGLLLLTNDGEWANNLMHPRHETSKTYIATIRGVPKKEAINRFQTGIKIDNRLTAPARISITETTPTGATVKITIREGRNRQVRKMCEAIGHRVITLKRISIGEIKLDNLPPGKWRKLTESEIKSCTKS
jgi:23S rRNA pseudouridine2605 synthase